MFVELPHRRSHGAGPAMLPLQVTRLACRILPAGETRIRYRQEFTAELYDLTAGRQTVHALQILVSAWSLRSALADHESTVSTMPATRRRRPLRCLVRLHAWITESTEDGERFQTCRRCGTDRHDVPGHDHGLWAAAAGNSGI